MVMKKKRTRSGKDEYEITGEWRAWLIDIIDDTANPWTQAELARAVQVKDVSIRRILRENLQSSSLVVPITRVLVEAGFRAPPGAERDVVDAHLRDTDEDLVALVARLTGELADLPPEKKARARSEIETTLRILKALKE